METKFTLSLVRQLYKIATPKEFREVLTDINETDLIQLIRSVNDDLITIGEYLSEDYVQDNSRYYSSEYYVTTREGNILSQDEAYFCEYFEEYTDEVYTINNGRHNLSYCMEAINDAGDIYQFNGEYYTTRGLEYSSIVFLDNGDLCHLDDCYWDEEREEYTTEEPETYVNSYHSDITPRFVNFTEKPQFYIGFEIEKEDQQIKESLYISEFTAKCKNWRKEKDGSLNDQPGYELISPAYELKTELIEKDIKSNPIILGHINAKFNKDTCGGHINISEVGLTGNELFDKLKGYTPLFYALYYKRINKHYSKGKSNKDLKNDNEKYQAVKIHSNRIEYRIISAVSNFNTLLWRSKLFELIINNPTDCPKTAFFNTQTILKNHLEEIYSPAKLQVLTSRIIEYTKQFENITL